MKYVYWFMQMVYNKEGMCEGASVPLPPMCGVVSV